MGETSAFLVKALAWITLQITNDSNGITNGFLDKKLKINRTDALYPLEAELLGYNLFYFPIKNPSKTNGKNKENIQVYF